MGATETDPPEPPSSAGSRPGLGVAGAGRWRRDPVARLVAAATFVGLVARLAWLLWVGERVPQTALIDPARYLGFARNLADGRGYREMLTGQPTAYYPPGYPFFLGGLQVLHDRLPLGGSFVFFVGAVQAAVGALLVPLGAFVARRVGSRPAAVVAAFVLALYPNLVFHTAVVLGETLYNTLFMAFLAVAVSRRWSGRRLTPAFAAATAAPLALAIMVRPISAVVVPALVLCWWLGARDLRVVLRATGALAVVLAAVMVPWAVRNQIVMGAFVPMSTNTGDNLCIGHHDGATGGFAPCLGEEGAEPGPETEVRNDDDKTAEALRWMRGHWREEPRLTWRRFRVMFLDDGDHDAIEAIQSYPNPLLGTERWMAPATERRLVGAADASYLVVGVIGMVGLVLLIRRREPFGVLVVLSALGTAAVPLAFFGDSRFKVPVVPLLVIAGAVAIGVAVEAIGRSRVRVAGSETGPAD